MSIKLSVDTLGSETSLSEIISGLNESSLRNEDYFFYLFGNKDLINKELSTYKSLVNRSEIVHCEEEISKPPFVILEGPLVVILTIPPVASPY